MWGLLRCQQHQIDARNIAISIYYLPYTHTTYHAHIGWLALFIDIYNSRPVVVQCAYRQSNFDVFVCLDPIVFFFYESRGGRGGREFASHRYWRARRLSTFIATAYPNGETVSTSLYGFGDMPTNHFNTKKPNIYTTDCVLFLFSSTALWFSIVIHSKRRKRQKHPLAFFSLQIHFLIIITSGGLFCLDILEDCDPYYTAALIRVK